MIMAWRDGDVCLNFVFYNDSRVREIGDADGNDTVDMRGYEKPAV
jgi:hypothetical protein